MSEHRHRYRPELQVAPEPEEEPPVPAPSRGAALLLKVLTGAVVLLLVLSGWLLFTVFRLQQGQSETTAFIEGRGAARDAENERLNNRIDAAVCNVLDSLPAGGLFDPIRAQYGCGPGIPVDELDPGAAQNLADIIEQGQAAPALAVPPSEPTEAAPTPSGPTLPPGAVITPPARPSTASPTPAQAQTAPSQPAPTAPAAPTTTPPPLVDLGPVTDTVCGLLRVCI